MANLDTTQLQALQTDITVTHAAEMYEGKTLLEWWNQGNDQEISEWYALEAAPEVLIWRENVGVDEFAKAVLYTDLLAQTAVELMVYEHLLGDKSSPVDMAAASIRDGLAAIFAGAPTTVANLLDIGKRPATNGEELYSGAASGAGGGTITLIYGQQITRKNVEESRTA